ncbi:MAG: serine/threonine-protein kinase [Gemmatimonas sp.]|uniref:protein kinase domain-containing protein n=2 Tax=Gemmatimonas sp. TaxID=1962908 RepID=UPI0025B97D04|nr:protein kinase [Gemmatimonas sp.]MCA2986937.1 serine/threonine-protein kinase [Gemmatimonas sp.]
MTEMLARLTAALEGRYRVERELGAGGMATVYLAHDLRHERDVAIKVLHPDLGAALGAERFLTEIKTTAKLQHPHILPLLDSGAADGLLYYVMPYVKGETLRARLERERQLPIADALRMAREVAGALDHAHKQGIIHRDIKPENILLQEGSALVADFGIALAVQQAGGARMTQTGLSLGTPQYMSPEQAMGERTIDARSDVYALGAVTYEMLAGEPPFSGPTTQAIVARVLTERPAAIRAVRDTVPDGVEAAVFTALAKLPADRFGSAAAFAEALTATAARDTMSAAASRRTIRGLRPVLITAALALGLGMAAGWGLSARSSASAGTAATSMVTSLEPLAGETWSGRGNDVVISPDARAVAIVGRTANWNGLIIRALDSVGSRYLPNTAGASSPFWSMDATRVGFFADRMLKVVDLQSGAVTALCASSIATNRGSWGRDDVILYVPEFDGRVFRTTGAGRECVPLDFQAPGDSALSSQVEFLADGEHFILSNSDFAWLGRVGDSTRTLLATTSLRRTVPATDAYLLLSPRGAELSTLFAQRVDLASRQLVGAPVALLRDVLNPGGRSPVSVARNGTMLVRTKPQVLGYPSMGRRFARFSEAGQWRDTLRATDTFGQFRVNDDGTIVHGGFHVAQWEARVRGWTDLRRAETPPRTFLNPVWGPGDTLLAVGQMGFPGDSVVIVDLRTGQSRRLSGFPDRRRRLETTDWTRDGRYILLEASGGNANPPSDAMVVDVTTGTLSRLFDDGTDVFGMRVSPDGRYVAYAATRGGETDVFVRPFPGPGTPIRLSSGGGASPAWRGSRELLYVAGRAVLAVTLDQSGTPAGTRTVIAEATLAALGAAGELALDVSPNGRQIVVAIPGDVVSPLLVISNWQRRLPSGAAAR